MAAVKTAATAFEIALMQFTKKGTTSLQCSRGTFSSCVETFPVVGVAGVLKKYLKQQFVNFEGSRGMMLAPTLGD